MLDDVLSRNRRITEYLARSGGASAKCIAAHLTSMSDPDGSYPQDASDFGRCEGLLEFVPELRADFSKMATLNPYWLALVSRWTEIKHSNEKTALIKSIIDPIHAADPGVFEMSEGVTVRAGDVPKDSDKPRMKETPEDKEVKDKTYRSTANELRQFVQRIERLESEKKDIAEQTKEVKAEAKARGYDIKAMMKIIAERKRDADDLAEEQAVMDMYREALGMR